MEKKSEIIEGMVDIIYPIIIMFGIYVIINGHVSPGGGFQGGAVLASLYIGRYIVDDKAKVNLESLKILEKSLFALILIVPSIMLLINQSFKEIASSIAYLITMNMLIGLKVFIGLTIIFFRFVHHEYD